MTIKLEVRGNYSKVAKSIEYKPHFEMKRLVLGSVCKVNMLYYLPLCNVYMNNIQV